MFKICLLVNAICILFFLFCASLFIFLSLRCNNKIVNEIVPLFAKLLYDGFWDLIHYMIDSRLIAIGKDN